MYYTEKTKDEPQELNSFLKNISITLKHKVTAHVLAKIIVQNKYLIPILKGN